MLRTTAIFFAFFAALCVAHTAAAQQPVVSQFHSIDESGVVFFDAEGNARAVVDDILKSFGITQVNWTIKITSSERSTQFAVAKFDRGSGDRSIVFNSGFLKRISETIGKWAAYCVAAHEIGHLLRSHFQNRFVSLREAELEADYDCGFALGKLNADYQQASSVLEYIPNTREYPLRHERREAIGRGWRDATGLPVDGLDEFDNPALRAKRHTLVLSKFNLKQNRDIFGADLAATNGVPGIPSTSYTACADKCRGDDKCAAFSFDKWNGWCFLKSAAATTVLDPKSVTGIKKTKSAPAAPGTAFKFSVARNRSFPDAPWDEVPAADRKTCQCMCGNSKRCVAFTFVEPSAAAPNNCKFFSQSDGYFEAAGAVSGYKEEFVAVAGQPDAREASVIKQSQGLQVDCRKQGSPPP